MTTLYIRLIFLDNYCLFVTGCFFSLVSSYHRILQNGILVRICNIEIWTTVIPLGQLAGGLLIRK